jgi:hypothetical protein
VSILIAIGCVELTPCEKGFAVYEEDGTAYGSFDEAQDAHTEGDLTLDLCPGTHQRVSWGWDEGDDANLTLRGAGAESTEITGGEEDMAVVVASPATVSNEIRLSDISIVAGTIDELTDECDDGHCTSRVGGGFVSWGAIVTLERVSIRGNESDFGTGIYVGRGREMDTQLIIRDSEVISNQGSAGSGAALEGDGARLVSENTDWGSGDTDNEGDDVAFLDADTEVAATFEFDGIASFVCDGATGTCE